ncbi:DivIVA [Desulforapulum autotrophicum HRM2]|uniref:DivIVA n=1 Tax=Desulforapulum autotrophicum (strain ATCC 43914 / DSM 3382 / VKM B-1955 / HRM2) TaxID=177437 RepID=C0QHQ4_DESAH|nr:DivIVA domain-containing protein [Desulforapulum autotrophicum]ACN13612.1 DivIVA [Desulforapulum autotrophicum HRM2]
MGITPAVIKQKEFNTRFRGFDVHEVDGFLEEVAHEVTRLNREISTIKEERHRLDLENQGYQKREMSLKRVMIQSQKVLDQMKLNARKSAELVIANAEVEAEKILNRAHQRLSQLHSDITELKRQRMQIEVQIGSVIESHAKLLEMSKQESKESEATDVNLRFIKQA